MAILNDHDPEFEFYGNGLQTGIEARKAAWYCTREWRDAARAGRLDEDDDAASRWAGQALDVLLTVAAATTALVVVYVVWHTLRTWVRI